MFTGGFQGVAFQSVSIAGTQSGGAHFDHPKHFSRKKKQRQKVLDWVERYNAAILKAKQTQAAIEIKSAVEPFVTRQEWWRERNSTEPPPAIIIDFEQLIKTRESIQALSQAIQALETQKQEDDMLLIMLGALV